MSTNNMVMWLIGLTITLLPHVALSQGLPDIIWQVPAHTGIVRDVTFNADGTTIASGSSDDSARLWDASTASLLDTYSPHDDGVLSVDFSPDGQTLASGYVIVQYGSTGKVHLWDVAQGSVLSTYTGCYVQYSPDGSFLASGGGGVIRYVENTRVSDGQRMWLYSYPSYVNDVAYSPAGDVVAIAGWDNTTVLLDAVTGSVLHTLTGHSDDVSAIAFSPDGQTIASGAGGFDATNDASIKLWRVSDGVLLGTLPGHGDWVHDLDFSPDGASLISVGRDGTYPSVNPKIKLWDVSDGSLTAFYDESVAPTSVAYAPDGLSFCYGRGDGELALASLTTTVGVNSQDGPFAPGGRAYNVPNPFNPTTAIHFSVADRGRVRVDIFDVSGRLVNRLFDEVTPAGEVVINWSGKNEAGKAAGSGVYIARITLADGEVLTTKMVLLK